MFDLVNDKVLKQLLESATATLGTDHDLTLAIELALASPAPEAVALVLEELAKLNDETRETLLRETHQTLALDTKAILKMWNPNSLN